MSNHSKLTSAHGELTVADYLLAQLALWGVRRIYGVIGDANLYLLDAIARQDQISYIGCKHECSAALMASAEAKLTGRIGVCLATSGPGIANLINGLADAAQDRAGVLAITGQVELSKIGTKTKQYINQQSLLAAIADTSELVVHPDALAEIVRDCLIRSQVMGKVTHLSLPLDMMNQKVSFRPVAYLPYLHQEQLFPPNLAAEAAAKLSHARRPLMLIGRGAKAAAGVLVQLAETIGAAVVTTMPARSLYPNDHSLYAGGLGQAGSEAASTLISESELILVIGATWWPEDYVHTEAEVIQIDMAVQNIGVGHPVHNGLIGDAGQIIPMMLERIQPLPGYREEWRTRIQDVAGTWKQRIEQEAADTSEPLAPQAIMKIVSEYADEDAIITLDTGDHTLWYNRIFQAKRKQEILLSGRWRTLGFAVPAAIAAKLEYPHRQVIAIAGDGGVLQSIVEMLTAVEFQLPIIVLILKNGTYAMESNRMQTAGLSLLGSQVFEPDFAKMAEAMGGLGMTCRTTDELKVNLRQAIRAKKPALLEISAKPTMVPHTKI